MPRALCIAVVIALAGCGKRDTTTQFPHSTDEILNPERGYHIDIDLMKGRDFSFVRRQGYALGYAGVGLDRHRYEALPPSLLEDLAKGFEAARDAGIKVILRFVYNHSEHGEDAPKWSILAHIGQLTPLLRNNADVIAVLDAGFIGAWGEWHSSAWGLDNQRDRGDVLWAILTALPASCSTMIRTPIYKSSAYGGPLDDARAFDGSHPARVGHLNSCFLASDTDLGTYTDPIDTWKDYVAQDGRFTPVGGETCKLNRPRTDCGTAEEELRRLRWSFLNVLYHPDVIATWQRQGCFDDIGRDLGYRLEVQSMEMDKAVAPGGLLSVTLRLRNTGYAAMYNARPVYLMLDDWKVLLPDDPRRWEPGKTITVRARVRVPASASVGMHRLGLWMPDADERLQTPKRVGYYSVRLANARWEEPVNVLTNAVVVDARVGGDVDGNAAEMTLYP